ncbi:unnamed protein product [Parnassius apollo]|uniref:unspecific monooxygenase n=1 Tax=Parnassius apollo TaxID=110799 RepID=A0A8S3XU56_PARAO|nr:unnamed protein product [Parnassius apollo]
MSRLKCLSRYVFVLSGNTSIVVMLIVIWSVVILAALTLYFRQLYSRFSSYGVKQFKPIPILGNNARIMLRMNHFSDDVQRLYNAFPEERFVGRFEFLKPTVVIKDIELIKKITVKDFEHFLDHRSFVNDNVDPFFGRNLVLMKGDEWKDMRSTLSPAFTSSKMRLMVPFMVEVGEQMIRTLMKEILNSSGKYIDVDGKDLTTRYANDVIASCAFGLKVDSYSDKSNIFYKMGKMAATFNFKQLLKVFALMTFPTVSSILRLSVFEKSARDFFWNLVMNTMNEREAKQVVRPDMIHLLMEAKKGRLTHEDKGADTDAGFATVEESSVGKKNVDRVWTDIDIVAQAVLFFIAGFDSVSSAMSFALHEIATHPEVQQRLYEEIKKHNGKNRGNLDYNSIQNLKYLDMVVSEVLRLWPPGVALDRLCTKDYNLGKPNKQATQDFIVRKGESATIPVWAIHRDSKYYPDPEKFDPERFSEENKHLIKPLTYVPFGLGPRNCIGSRFALCEVKVMLYQLLLHMELSPCEKTCIPAKLSTSTFNVTMQGGHWFKMRCRIQ